MGVLSIISSTVLKESPEQSSNLMGGQLTPIEPGDYECDRVEVLRDHFCVSNGHRVYWVWRGVAKAEVSPPLQVPYYSQRDNSGQWWRECNSSSCAMVAEYYRPECLAGSDDRYVRLVNQFGDTTDHWAQTKALDALNIRSRFATDLGYERVVESLARHNPVVLGVLHRGTLDTPEGGHMIVAVGTYAEGLICHDPWGEGFSYVSHNGKNVKYPLKSLDRRWLVDGDNNGWGRLFMGEA